MNDGATGNELFTRAEWYDRSINWSARLRREIPVLVDVLGPPGDGGILDAGCGTGHQACALARRGYRVVGADASEEMLTVARRAAPSASGRVSFVVTPYVDLRDKVGGGFDGVYCLGNALAAAASRAAVEDAVGQFARCLRPGGRLFIQILNFVPMRSEAPCIRGPRLASVDGVDHISVRHFVFIEDVVEVTNITLLDDGGWRCQAHGARLYPITLDELREWCERFRLHVDDTWGSYAREAFDEGRSSDLLLVATRV